MIDMIVRWWEERSWRKKHEACAATGTRYYGDGGTLHNTGYVDVETIGGEVVAVWFRCQPLPFKQTPVDNERAAAMRRMLTEVGGMQLCGVEVKDELYKK